MDKILERISNLEAQVLNLTTKVNTLLNAKNDLHINPNIPHTTIPTVLPPTISPPILPTNNHQFPQSEHNFTRRGNYDTPKSINSAPFMSRMELDRELRPYNFQDTRFNPNSSYQN